MANQLPADLVEQLRSRGIDLPSAAIAPMAQGAPAGAPTAARVDVGPVSFIGGSPSPGPQGGGVTILDERGNPRGPGPRDPNAPNLADLLSGTAGPRTIPLPAKDAGPQPEERVLPGGAVFAQPPAPSPGAAAPRAVTVPAHEIPLVDPARQARIGEAMNAQGTAAGGEVDALAQQQQDLARQKAHMGEDVRVDAMLQQREQQDRAQQFSARLQALDQKAQDLSESRIDPDHFWQSRSVGQKIVGVIGMALGGFLQGYRGGTNQFAEMLDREIARDTEAQMHNLQGKRASLADQRTLLAEQLKVWGDRDAAVAATNAAKYRAAELELDATVAQSQSAVVRARGEQAKAAITQKREEELAKLNHYAAAQTVMQGGGGASGVTPKDQANIFKDPASGQTYVARDPESKKKLVESAATTQNIQALAHQYQQQIQALGTADKVGGKLGINSDAFARAENTYNTLLSEARKANDDGVWKKSEVELFEQTLAPPARLLGSNGAAQAGQIAAMAQRAHQNAMATHSPLPVREGWTRDARGNLQPTAGYTGGEYQAPAQVQFTPGVRR